MHAFPSQSLCILMLRDLRIWKIRTQVWGQEDKDTTWTWNQIYRYTMIMIILQHEASWNKGTSQSRHAALKRFACVAAVSSVVTWRVIDFDKPLWRRRAHIEAQNPTKPYGTSAGLKSNLLGYALQKNGVSGSTPRSPLPSKAPRDFGKGAPHGAYLEMPLGPATGKELDSMPILCYLWFNHI